MTEFDAGNPTEWMQDSETGDWLLIDTVTGQVVGRWVIGKGHKWEKGDGNT